MKENKNSFNMKTAGLFLKKIDAPYAFMGKRMKTKRKHCDVQHGQLIFSKLDQIDGKN